MNRNHVPVALGGEIILISSSQWLELRERLKGCRTIRERGKVAIAYLTEQGLYPTPPYSSASCGCE